MQKKEEIIIFHAACFQDIKLEQKYNASPRLSRQRWTA